MLKLTYLSLFSLTLFSCKDQPVQLINTKAMIEFVAPKVKSVEKVTDKKLLESITLGLMKSPFERKLKIEKQMVLNPVPIDGEGEPPVIITYENNPLSTIVVNLGIYEGTQYQYMNLVENGSVINGENFYATLTSENDALVTKYLDSEGSELARFTVVNGILTAAVIHEQIQMKPGNFGSRWVACVTRVGLHFTDGTFSGAASGLFCMAWGGYCAAAITVLCAGTAYYHLQI